MSKRNAIAAMRFYESCSRSGKAIFLVLGDLTRRIIRFEKKRHGAENLPPDTRQGCHSSRVSDQTEYPLLRLLPSDELAQQIRIRDYPDKLVLVGDNGQAADMPAKHQLRCFFKGRLRRDFHRLKHGGLLHGD